jgi:hypothetical protein
MPSLLLVGEVLPKYLGTSALCSLSWALSLRSVGGY